MNPIKVLEARPLSLARGLLALWEHRDRPDVVALAQGVLPAMWVERVLAERVLVGVRGLSGTAGEGDQPLLYLLE